MSFNVPEGCNRKASTRESGPFCLRPTQLTRNWAQSRCRYQVSGDAAADEGAKTAGLGPNDQLNGRE